jgi:PilZ domain
MQIRTNTRAVYTQSELDDRCAHRTVFEIPAMLRASGGGAFSTTVIDISIAGFACDAVCAMQPGNICWLKLPGLGSLQAEVIWNDGRIVGCAFSTLLHRAVLDRLFKRMRVSAL